MLGVRTNREFLQKLAADPDVRAGRLDTGLIERFLGTVAFERPRPELLEAAASRRIPAPNGSAWHDARGWRIGEHRPTRFRVTDGHGLETDVVVGDALVASSAAMREFGDVTWAATSTAIFELEFLSRDQQFAAHRLTLTRVAGEADPNIRTPMPGTVVAVERTSGDEVEPGQVLVTIEAMKMEHKLLASVAGVVTIDVVQGDQVATDQVVATISPHKGAAA